jgi:hypothetical protein
LTTLWTRCLERNDSELWTWSSYWQVILHQAGMIYCSCSSRLLESSGFRTELFRVRSLQRCYKQDMSRVLLVVWQLPDSIDVSTEAEGSTTLETVIRRLVKTQKTEKV